MGYNPASYCVVATARLLLHPLDSTIGNHSDPALNHPMPATRPLRRSVLIPNQHTLAQQLPLLLLCFSLGCFLTLTLPRLTHAQAVPPSPDRSLTDRSPQQSPADRSLATALAESALLDRLPPAQAHPLPPSLQADRPHLATALGSARTAAPDYFDQIQPSPLGYLVWSHFPVTVYRDANNAAAGSGEAERQAVWRSAVDQAVQAWQIHMPLAWTDDRDQADIQILRSRPPLRYQEDGSIARARTAETRYKFRLTAPPTLTSKSDQPDNAPQLQPQFTLYLGPGQAPASLATTARHELGHALGLWGHSPSPQDVMYAEQTVQNQPQEVSQRDVNTLRRVYQQPTRVGWPLTRSGS